MTGHKSVSSLAVYHKISHEEKMQIGHAITRRMQENRRDRNQIRSSTTPRQVSTPQMSRPQLGEGPSTSTSNTDMLAGVDIDNLFCDFTVQKDSNNIAMSQMQSSIFKNCTIQNVNVTFKQ